MKKTNPFTLSFGELPTEFISRQENTDAIISTFTADHPISRTYLIEGIRGSGKTVLMTSIASKLGSEDDWIVVNLNSTLDLMTDFARELTDKCQKEKKLLPSGFSVSIAGVGFGVSNTVASSTHESISIVKRILENLKKKNKRVLITIDEVIHDDNMRTFASEFQIFIREGFSLYLIMTGLYENIDAVQNDPSLTFLLRSPKIHLEPLGILPISYQYESIFSISFEKAKELADYTRGYAFAFQALGLLYYEYRESEDIEQILRRLDVMLDEYVYRKIWSSLSGQDKRVIKAMNVPLMKTGDMCKLTGMSPSTFNKYRERLIKKGILEAPEHGVVCFALPRFMEVVRAY